ncbi:MAG: 2-hydroxymuconic semialdehyde hydrolase [Schlesneria sp.]|nr:2-hydroxymuconic semialdehyde hydrolase [Schlesneria sp.]
MRLQSLKSVLDVIAILFALSLLPHSRSEAEEPAMATQVYYRTTTVDGLTIFYRETGPKDAPTIVMLHGFPSSSRMFEPLLARLGDRYHLVAPDYPGFGHSDAPGPDHFDYTFDRLAKVIDKFTEAIGLSHFTLYMQDYGGPVGFRMAIRHPDRIDAFIIQNAVAHSDGLGKTWDTRRAFWNDRGRHEVALHDNLLSLEATRRRHVGNDPKIDRYDPDLWTDEYAFLSRPGVMEIQINLFYDYRTNVAAYSAWQAWMRKTRPRTLVVWGKHDPSFESTEPQAFKQDLPDAEIHMLDAGHFALDTAANEIASRIDGFLKSRP